MTRQGFGVCLPENQVQQDSPDVRYGFGKALVILRSTSQIKSFCAELVEALKELEPAEPENKLFVARRDGALDTWKNFQTKAAPTAGEVETLIEKILGAAIATQKAEPAPETEPGARTRSSPMMSANAVYAQRRRAVQ